MYKKQDSNFWWAINNYVKDDSTYQKLSNQDKLIIEQSFRIAYYGLFQYQLYTGKELTSIESSNIQELSDYIVKNYDRLFKTVYKDLKNEVDLHAEEQCKKFQTLLEKIIFPYINDYSFVSKESLTITSDLIATILMQLCFKNRYDINLENENALDKLYFSSIYPFLLTVLIADPTNPQTIYQNIKQVFNKENINAALNTGRTLSESEKEYIAPLLDTLESTEDFQTMLLSFNEEHWSNLDQNARFKNLYQLSKYANILLKENMHSLDQMDSENEINELLHNYLEIILKSEAECLVAPTMEPEGETTLGEDETATFQTLKFASTNFLYPISTKDFNAQTIANYYETVPKNGRLKFSIKKLETFINGILYAVSYVRLIYQAAKDSPPMETLFIERKKLALVNSLKLFEQDQENHFQSTSHYLDNMDEIFLTAAELKSILAENSKKNNDITKQLKEVLRTISFLISLEPQIVKEMDYSLEEIIKYYLICLGPYQNDRSAFEKGDIKALSGLIKKLNKQLNLEKYLAENDDYYSTFYLINKLLTFKKNH